MILLNLIESISVIGKKIQDLEKQRDLKIKEIQDKYDAEIEDYRRAFKVNLDLNEACMECKGTGKVRESDGDVYECRSHLVNCGVCNGTGLKRI